MDVPRKADEGVLVKQQRAYPGQGQYQLAVPKKTTTMMKVKKVCLMYICNRDIALLLV